MSSTKINFQDHKIAESISNTEYGASSTWDDTGRYVRSLTNEPDFINYLQEYGIKNEKGSMEYADALSRYTDAVLGQQDGLIDEKTATQIRLVANAPYIVHASRSIDSLERYREQHKLSGEDEAYLHTLKHQAAWYNQMLNGYMNTHHDESFSAINQAIAGQVVQCSARSDLNHNVSRIRGIANGARTEAAARHLFDACGVIYDPATIDDDVRGADIILTLPNGRRCDIDFKRSLDELAANNNGYDFEQKGKIYSIFKHSNGHKKILFFPGFTDKDLGDSLRLSNNIIDQRKDKIREQLGFAIRDMGKKS